MSELRTVAQSTGLPIMIYNHPVAYHVDIMPAMFRDLAGEENIVAIKESSDNVRRVTDLINLHGDRFLLFSGVDDLVLESILLGASGGGAGLVNAFPHENQALWQRATSGQWERARELYRWYTPLLHLDTHPKLVQYIKLATLVTGFALGAAAFVVDFPLLGTTKLITDGWGIPFMMQAWWLFCLCCAIFVGVSWFTPPPLARQVEGLTWPNPLSVLRGQFSDPRLLSLGLLAVIGALYGWLHKGWRWFRLG